jgi:hypothetical protein
MVVAKGTCGVTADWEISIDMSAITVINVQARGLLAPEMHNSENLVTPKTSKETKSSCGRVSDGVRL